ncbi:small secreted protein [Hypoxylon rubiginosum]|uniref:Small secreted protein n=1 Tax=Hypoxylon rubiginosum TaxID=110542 RepID=A0ACC0CMG5_9PEZI|nr:small secreted protein [Hypoxylon rubiginosum]
MQFTNALLATLLSATALAAPTPAAAKSAMADVAQWTIEGLKRVCDGADTSCTWTFTVDTHVGATTPCSFTVKSGAKPASQTDSAGNVCGAYTVGSGWSDQFGAENGFTTLSVVDYASKLAVWPSYTDKQLAGGAVVTPDLSFAPTNIAW